MARKVIDHLIDGKNNPISGAIIRFSAWRVGFDSGTVPRSSQVEVVTGEAGDFEVTLENGVYQVSVAIGGQEAVPVLQGRAVITDGDDASLAEVLGLSEPISSAVQAAIDAATRRAVFVFSGSDLTLSPEHSGRLIFTTSNSPVSVHFPDTATSDLDGTFEGGLIQGGDGKVTFTASGDDALLAEGGLTATAGRGAPVSYKLIQPLLWWLGGQRSAAE